MVEYIIAGAAILIARSFLKNSKILEKTKAKIKGALGERKLAKKLKHLKAPGKVKILRDGLFHADWGTSQIDAIAITRYGIIPLEMKNMSATIYGFVGEPMWIAAYGKDNKKNFPSPIRQNNSHVIVLKNLLKDQFPQMNYLPLVVFSNDATLHIQNSRDKVCHLKDVNKVIKRQLGEPILTDRQVEEVASILERNMIKGRQARKNHVTAINLRKETSKAFSNEYMAQVEAQLRAEAAKKPILSSNGIKPDEPSHSSSDSCDNRPLFEILKNAESRASTHNSATQPNRNNSCIR